MLKFTRKQWDAAIEKAGGLRVEPQEGGNAVAVFSGDKTYFVMLESAFCNCHAGQYELPCKHVAAVVTQVGDPYGQVVIE